MTTAAKPAPPANGNIETLNHFDKSHPKDDLEIKKQRDESVGRAANKKDNKKGMHRICFLIVLLPFNQNCNRFFAHL